MQRSPASDRAPQRISSRRQRTARARRSRGGAPPWPLRPPVEAFISIGAPTHDLFTQSVFDHRLRRTTNKIAIVHSGIDDLRRQVMQFLAPLQGSRNSLDIIADAPGGIQRIFGRTVLSILADPGTKQDDELVALIRSKFSQVRVLGCATAVDAHVRAHVRELANRLALPVLGTLRVIAYEDFDDVSFQDTQRLGQELVQITSVVMPNEPEPQPASGPTALAASTIQQVWLDAFGQVTVDHADIVDAPASAGWRWVMSEDPLARPVAKTDVIRTAVDANVTLQLPSGATLPAQVLARGTLLRLQSRQHGALYVNVPPGDSQRLHWLQQASAWQPT